MRYILSFLSLLAIATFGISAEVDTIELVAPSPAIQGVWVVKMSSADGGKTLQPDAMTARMTKTTFVMPGGTTYHIKQVVQMPMKNGAVGNVISFTDSDTTIVVCDAIKGMFMVQFFKDDANGKTIEACRSFFTVEK